MYRGREEYEEHWETPEPLRNPVVTLCAYTIGGFGLALFIVGMAGMEIVRAGSEVVMEWWRR